MNWNELAQMFANKMRLAYAAQFAPERAKELTISFLATMLARAVENPEAVKEYMEKTVLKS